MIINRTERNQCRWQIGSFRYCNARFEKKRKEKISPLSERVTFVSNMMTMIYSRNPNVHYV